MRWMKGFRSCVTGVNGLRCDESEGGWRTADGWMRVLGCFARAHTIELQLARCDASETR
jgi:hypothetical protein